MKVLVLLCLDQGRLQISSDSRHTNMTILISFLVFIGILQLLEFIRSSKITVGQAWLSITIDNA